MLNVIKFFIYAVALVVSFSAFAETACPEHFSNGMAPEFTNNRLSGKTVEICYSQFAVMHSGITYGPLWAAEHLTADRVLRAKQLDRKNTFHADPNIPEDQRAELNDYKGSGFDRGHMAPNKDFDNPKAQNECFSLANMIPQNPNNNQNLWEGIESAIRTYTLQEKELYIVTGPLFLGDKLQRLNGKILIPTQVFKAIYNPSTRRAGAYLANNAEGMDYKTVSIAELNNLTGFDVFPGLSDDVKRAGMILPEPTPHGSGSVSTTYLKPNKSSHSSTAKSVNKIVKQLFR